MRQPIGKPCTQPTETSASTSSKPPPFAADSSRPPPNKTPTTQWFSCSQLISRTSKEIWDIRKPLSRVYTQTQTPHFILTYNIGLNIDMELLCILQSIMGLVPPRVVGSNHLFSYGKGGRLRAEKSNAMFSMGDSIQGKDKDKDNDRGRGKGKIKGFGK